MKKKRGDLLRRLEKMKSWKKSNSFYAERLGINVKEVEDLMKELNKDEEIPDLGESTFSQNFEKDEIKVSKIYDFPPKPEDVIEAHKIDTNKWKLSQIWIKQTAKGYLTSASFTPKKSSELTVQDFSSIVKAVTPLPKILVKASKEGNPPKVSLILPKQDAHFNKLDVNGENDINKRFQRIEEATYKMVKKAGIGNTLEKITYIVGSDQFNSEWTSETTKGTPQANILTYQDAFLKIGQHESTIINHLLSNANKVDVLFIPGNHDEYVGWHLVTWLQALFSNTKRIRFDISPKNRKYERFGNSAIMYNHGDVLKAKDLAHKFPIEFKHEWSNCDNYFVFVGDKHNELSSDIHGIKFFQIPALSKARGQWDDKQGHTCTKAEMTAFVITENNGISDVYKEIL